MFAVAAGILIAALVIVTIYSGLTVAFDRDNRNLGAHWPGYWIAGVGVAGAALVIYLA